MLSMNVNYYLMVRGEKLTKRKIDYYNEKGSVVLQAKYRASTSGSNLPFTVIKKLFSYALSTIARWIPVSSVRIMLQRWRGVVIGKNVFLGANVVLDNAYPEHITIHDDCSIAGDVYILTHSNPKKHFSGLFESYVYTVEIKRGAWIGIGSIILPGVTIGEYSVVSAGSVVSSSIPPYSIVKGNPARIVTTFPPELITIK